MSRQCATPTSPPYLPMHTATRLAARLIPRVRQTNPTALLAAYGLYAPLQASYLRNLGVKTTLGGEFEEGLTMLGAGERPNCCTLREIGVAKGDVQHLQVEV